MFSCNTCRKDKLKCDRGRPCANCLRRKREAYCVYSNENLASTNRQGVVMGLETRLRSLDAKLQDLESRMPATSPAGSTRDSGQRLYAIRNADSSPSPSLAASTDLLALAPARDSMQLENGDIPFTNTSHWKAILGDARKELERNDSSPDDDAGGRQKRYPQGPALLTGVLGGSSMARIETLPPRETADALVFRCLDSGEAFMINVHVPTFKREYVEFWRHPHNFPPAWLSLLFSVLCCGIWMDHTTDANAEGLNLPGVFETYRSQSAAFLAMSDIATPGRYKVEAAIVYLGIEYLRADSNKTDVSVLLGTVARMAITSGFHRSAQTQAQMTAFDAEMRRRSWLLLLVTDCSVAVATGLPRAIPRGLGDAGRPRNLLDDDFGPFTVALPPGRTEDDVCVRIAYMLKLEAILSIATDIADSAPVLASSPERIAQLDDELERIRESIPAALRMPATSPSVVDGDEKITLWRFNLEITYQRTRCILHRPFLARHQHHLPSDDHRQARAFRETCVAAAHTILTLEHDLFRLFWSTPKHRYRVWFGASRSVSYGLTAAMAVCLELIYRAKDEEQQQQQQPTGASGPATTGELIRSLNALHASWARAPKLSPEFERAAAMLAAMLRRMDIYRPPALQRTDDEASAPHGEERCNPDPPPPESSGVAEGDLLFLQNPIYDILNDDGMEDMFNWDLWDQEMQSLDL